MHSMAIISGCDYLDGLPGLGVKSAYALFKQHTSSVKVRLLPSVAEPG